MEKITKAVCEFYGVSYGKLFVRNRTNDINKCRQIAMYIGVTIFGHTHSEAGNFFLRDHSTSVHANKKIAGELKIYPQKRKELANIRHIIYSGETFKPRNIKKGFCYPCFYEVRR